MLVLVLSPPHLKICFISLKIVDNSLIHSFKLLDVNLLIRHEISNRCQFNFKES
jgi:hypothetical protein